MSERLPAGEPTAQHSGRFFGRQAEIAWVTEQLGLGQTLLAITGPPRIGKTTLLLQLIRHLADEYLAVYLDASTAGDWPTTSPLLKVAAQVGRCARTQANLRVDAPDAAAFEQDPLGAWQAYLDTVTAQLEGQQVLLLIDHIEDVSLDWVCVLCRTRCPLILAARDRGLLLACRRDNGMAPLSTTLGGLGNEAAGTMIKALVGQRAQIDPWAVRRVQEATSSHPHYIRLLCRVLVERSVHSSPMTPTDVEEALRSILSSSISEFVATWENALPGERIVLSLFAALRGLGGIATQYDIQTACARYKRPLSLEHIVTFLDGLVERDVLEKLGANSYRFTLELFRLWVQRHYPPALLIRRSLWRLGKPAAMALWMAARQVLNGKPAMWAGVGVVALIALTLVLQAAFRTSGGRTQAPLARTTATTGATAKASQTWTPIAEATATAVPTPAKALPGYDLVFMSRKGTDAPWQIFALNTRTGQRLRLTNTNSNERTPEWSPDGQRLVFASDRDENREIYVMDLLADSRVTNLTQHKSPDWQPAWAPDGKRVAFSSYRDENWEIYQVNADGTGLVRLTEHPENDLSPAWSPDGQKLLFVSRRRGDADLFVMEVGTGELTQLTRSAKDEYDPAWSPDGQWIAFVTLIEDQSDIFVMGADGSNPTNITNSIYANDFQPTWTLDSQGLVFVSYTSARGSHDLYTMQRDGSQVIALTNDDNDNIAPSLRSLD